MADWTEEEKVRIWNKAERCGEKNEEKGFRKDCCGAWIKRDAYGDRDSRYGWEIDHIEPSSKGGDDIISNARPLHWKNNASRQNNKLKTIVTAKEDKNILVDTGKEFNP